MIDAAGKLITPGFINMHSHSDCSAAMYPNMESTLGQGITTEFVGHCGLGVAPVQDDWLYVSGEKGIHQGHAGAARGYPTHTTPILSPPGVCVEPFAQAYGPGAELDHLWPVPGSFAPGWDWEPIWPWWPDRHRSACKPWACAYRRDATEQEIAAMEDAPQRGHGRRRAGAEPGPDYEPGLFAGREGAAAPDEAGGCPGRYCHCPHPQPELSPITAMLRTFLDGLREFLDLGRESGARIHVSHIQSGYTVTPAHDGRSAPPWPRR